ncbi:MAG: biotin-dependent carboxyltransferase family protein [Chitinophagales bacterium]|nr:biotin-dependent carboxyltransferase family protein [Chitinophagales bacterium]
MLEVLHPGFYTSVQDLGRKRAGSLGVPCSGAMDAYSAKLANLILHNNENDAVLEITFGGCKLLFKERTTIAITGADFSAKINGRAIGQNAAIFINEGDILSFGNRRFGCRTYLALKGGFLTPKILGSRSYYKGITSDFLIQKGQELPYDPCLQNQSVSHASIKADFHHFTSRQIPCLKGPEFDWLSDKQKRQILTSTFTLSKDSDRMGIRLNEPIKNDLPSMLTSAVLPGTVQLTPSGKLIILMQDAQVTGGYPRVLQLMERSISRLAQKLSDEEVKFELKNF